MFGDHNEALAAPESAEHFAKSMQAICEASGAERFLLVRLRGATLREVRQVIHSGGIEAAALLDAVNSVAVHRLVLSFSLSALPSAVVSPDGDRAIDVPGYEHGVAVFARGNNVGCIVVFARQSPAVANADCIQMMASAYSASHSAMSGFPAEPAVVCNLTARELACLLHYVAGHDKKKTGETLGISARTVEGHLERARLRCGVDNTLAAAMKALNEGWIEPSEVRQLEAAG